ncbi:right-handed parallel beta-helix repeat-containing protein [Hansschlegelia sp. KR7-227]|uniref:right-handed parallel beta-helix repeat-containing protein n=1 Tax=Hansschlegelia sp. KR7-227 TaxID=3400914 RepID=UPI003C0799EE
MTIRLWIIFGALALLPALASTEARAQATRTWVSGVGDDVNPCSRTAPCKTFAGAISKTAAGGEINAVDNGAFGAVTITKSITIKVDHVEAGVLASGTTGVVVNAPANSKVVLEGLDIEGASLGTLPGLNGIRMIGQGSLTVLNCRIRNFNTTGITVDGAADYTRLIVKDTVILNAATGILIKGTKINTGVIDNVTIDNSSVAALQVDAPSSTTLSGSLLTGSALGLKLNAGAAVISYGDNIIRNGGLPTQTAPRL